MFCYECHVLLKISMSYPRLHAFLKISMSYLIFPCLCKDLLAFARTLPMSHTEFEVLLRAPHLTKNSMSYPTLRVLPKASCLTQSSTYVLPTTPCLTRLVCPSSSRTRLYPLNDAKKMIPCIWSNRCNLKMDNKFFMWSILYTLNDIKLWRPVPKNLWFIPLFCTTFGITLSICNWLLIGSIVMHS